MCIYYLMKFLWKKKILKMIANIFLPIWINNSGSSLMIHYM